jgi:hypothetical protein
VNTDTTKARVAEIFMNNLQFKGKFGATWVLTHLIGRKGQVPIDIFNSLNSNFRLPLAASALHHVEQCIVASLPRLLGLFSHLTPTEVFHEKFFTASSLAALGALSLLAQSPSRRPEHWQSLSLKSLPLNRLATMPGCWPVAPWCF